ncbi:hypothetical protein XELAEV_18014346mg [Xenopus laevis]|uniref:Uncharacterized protein n=1 Tax=Xenopus laevis TaxID=8355 RepID=A0A974HV77_XENLA|nr:hypothetical protein XELAEV_18014346mg [Xenopus laevis]
MLVLLSNSFTRVLHSYKKSLAIPCLRLYGTLTQSGATESCYVVESCFFGLHLDPFCFSTAWRRSCYVSAMLLASNMTSYQ